MTVAFIVPRRKKIVTPPTPSQSNKFKQKQDEIQKNVGCRFFPLNYDPMRKQTIEGKKCGLCKTFVDVMFLSVISFGHFTNSRKPVMTKRSGMGT